RILLRNGIRGDALRGEWRAALSPTDDGLRHRGDGHRLRVVCGLQLVIDHQRGLTPPAAGPSAWFASISRSNFSNRAFNSVGANHVLLDITQKPAKFLI